MLRPIVEANWFTYPRIKQESKLAALMSTWIKDFYGKGIIHRDEEDLHA